MGKTKNLSLRASPRDQPYEWFCCPGALVCSSWGPAVWELGEECIFFQPNCLGVARELRGQGQDGHKPTCELLPGTYEACQEVSCPEPHLLELAGTSEIMSSKPSPEWLGTEARRGQALRVHVGKATAPGLPVPSPGDLLARPLSWVICCPE